MISKRFKFNEQEIGAIVKVAMWTMGSTLITALISIVGAIEFPTEYALVPAVINIVLFALLKFVQGAK